MAKKLSQADKDLNALIAKKGRVTASRVILMERVAILDAQLANINDSIYTYRQEKSRVEGETLTATERSMVLARDYIPAIKSVRARTNLGLKEAKDLVDAYRQKNGL